MSILLERTSTVTDLEEKKRIEERLSMFDQLWNESPRVQQMKKQFREEAQKEARKEIEQKVEQKVEQRVEQERLRLQKEAEQERLRAQQERLKTLRSSLVSVTRVRFPDLTDFAQQQAERFDQPAVLDLLIQQVVAASDANMVRLLLNPEAE